LNPAGVKGGSLKKKEKKMTHQFNFWSSGENVSTEKVVGGWQRSSSSSSLLDLATSSEHNPSDMVQLLGWIL
jgi:hypothetical protein